MDNKRDKKYALFSGSGSVTVSDKRLKFTGDTLSINLKRMHEVQRLISTGLRDIHTWVKDECIIYSVQVQVWHADCEQNVYSTKGL